jgi:toxin ParE1/3/4
VKIEWSEPAVKQLENALAYIREHNAVAALHMYERIHARTEQLLVFPALGKPGLEPGTLDLVIPASPYILVYRIAGDVIQIGAIWHGRQSRAR